jgi:Arsenical resistance operon protein ArsD
MDTTREAPQSPATQVEGTPMISLYDPPLCCSTGLCGPSVDPTLLQVARDLRWLEARDTAVERFNLAQQPGAFAENPRVSGLMQAFGDRALPVTLVNGEIAFHGRYPSLEDLQNAINKTSAAKPAATSISLPMQSCDCEPETDCCS